MSVFPFPQETSQHQTQRWLKATCTTYHLSNVLSYDRHRLSANHHGFTISLTVEKKPSFFAQVVRDPKWRIAMQEELNGLESNNTWSLQPLPLGKKLVGCKWVYKIKLHADRTVERSKARLVAKGYNQVEGLDYRETLLLSQNL